jgi:hypothetical protein
MKAPPAAAEWFKAEYERLLGPGAAGDLLDRIGRDRALNMERRDLFLIYVPEDRLPIAGPLAIELTKRRVRVAFSEYEVASRDQLLAAAERGLAHHRAGALLVTSEFERKPWSTEVLEVLSLRLGKDAARLFLLHDLERPTAVAERLLAWLRLSPGP